MLNRDSADERCYRNGGDSSAYAGTKKVTLNKKIGKEYLFLLLPFGFLGRYHRWRSRYHSWMHIGRHEGAFFHCV